MTTKELILSISQKTGFSQKDIKTVLDSMKDIVIDRVAAKDEVKIFTGVTFCGVERPEHTARNPQTGETIVVPAKVQFKTKVGESVKRIIN